MLVSAEKNQSTTKKLTEDEITSTFFGPLEYFPPDSVFLFFETIIKPKLANPNLWPPKIPNDLSVTLCFWPKKRTSCGRDSEPDLVVYFKEGKDTFLNLIIEVKWKSEASSHEKGISNKKGDEVNIPNQLPKQWDAFNDAHQNTLHVYLVLNKDKALKEIDKIFDDDGGLNWANYNFDEREWYKRLVCISWMEVVYRLSNSTFGNTLLGKWSRGEIALLKKLGVFNFSFVGFNDLVEYLPDRLEKPYAFWLDFNGFHVINNSRNRSIAGKKVMFFQV